ncbi:MAG TPA: cell division protein, partial [Legionellales bacterium]|nr:cell division protein [Legionellales bacterium]
TLRMVIHSRYDEIQILKLIGASQRFILSPFLYAGAFYGLLGAMVAILSVDIIICLLQDYFKPLAVLYNYVGMIPLMSVMQVFSVMGIAICLGWAAAWVFVRYYLNAIEPV